MAPCYDAPVQLDQLFGDPDMNKRQRLAAIVNMSADAPDPALKGAVAQKMADEATAAMTAPGYDHAGAASKLEEMAEAYDGAGIEPDGDEEQPPVTMRRMAQKFRAMAAPAAAPSTMAGEDEKKEVAAAFARRLGLSLSPNLTSAQMFDAVHAAAVPASDIPRLVAAQVEQAMAKGRADAERAATRGRAERLVSMAVAGGYPREQSDALLRAASDPQTFDAIEASVRPYVQAAAGEHDPQLFEQQTFAGAPLGSRAAPRGNAASGPDRRVVKNELATWVVEGEQFSTMAIDMAESRDPNVARKLDALLSESERSHAGLRLIAANRVLKQERPDLWAAAEQPLGL